VRHLLKEKRDVTVDLGGDAGTRRMTAAIIARLESV